MQDALTLLKRGAAWGHGSSAPYDRFLTIRGESLLKTPAAAAPRATPTAVTVDLWYTLVFQRYDERRAYERSCREAWRVALEEAGASPTRAARWARAAEAQAARTGEPGGIAERATWLSDTAGITIDQVRLARAVDRSLARARIHLVPGARGFLERARRRGLRVGLLSNITSEPSEAIHHLLERTALERSLAVVALSGETGLSKPDPAAWYDCWRRLGVQSGGAIHIGDSPADIRGVQEAGGTAWLFLGADRWSPKGERTQRAAIDPRVPRFAGWAAVGAALFGRSAPPGSRPEAVGR
jgi:HAD superfamily hydrolase (TIGR01549 family)